MPHPDHADALVADIGGTNTRVGLAAGPTLLPETIRRFRNAEYPGLEHVLRAYVGEHGAFACKAASVAIAGPVRDGRGTLTNLDWTIDRETLAAATGADFTAVLNDLQAQGHALGRIAAENLHQVVEGAEPAPNASQLVIGVGTGFNVAPVHNAGEARLVAPSEAGHGNLPISNEAELRLCRYIEKAHGFAAVEEVLSGRGLERVYAWLGEEAGDPRSASAAEIMDRMGKDGHPRSAETVAIFVRMLGRVAGNQALDHLPFGGVFLAGGVARAMAPYFGRFGFIEAFRDKGRFTEFMGQFGVWVIEDDYAALIGSAAHLDRLARAV
ncbi:glucokinase [Rhodophyticola sp. MJ-SS7]|nr:glucokinase [Rhodophyticola sp. MJ-SS7]MDU8945132.1 glucokinase [Rhodophyticola sp. MJ-SS7]